MYGYATFSYNQILDHLKFCPVHTAVTTDVLKLKQFYAKEDELAFFSEAIMNSRYRWRVILTHIRISKRVNKIGQYSEVHKFAYVYLK